MFHFGFSYVGLVFLCMLLIPNFIWTKKKPLGYEEASLKENKFLLVLERIGEVLVSVLLLIFKDFNIDLNRRSALPLLVLAFVLMICYEFYWIRYFKSKRSLKDFYSSLFGIPVAGATYPVLAFFVLGLYGSNSFLLLASTILGIGHIGIHLGHRDSLFGKKRRRLPFRILKSLAAAFAGFTIIILIGYFGIKNAKFVKAFAFAKNPVFEDAYVNLNGQNQFIRVMGRNKENPVVILLHGGPSGPDGMMDYAFMDYLLDDYTYITWDQRGCGRTYYKNHAADPENKTASVGQLLEDINALVDYVFDKVLKEGIDIYGIDFNSPLYFISGEMDWTCPVIIARQYYEKINAPRKSFFEVKGCGHTPQGDKPLEVAKIIKDIGL